MASGYQYRSGPWELDSTIPSKGSTACTALDALKNDTGTTTVATAGAKIVAIALETKSSGVSATTPIQKLLTNSNRTKFVASPKNSSSLAATDVMGQFDLYGATGAMGFDRGVTTNGDFTVVRVLVTGTSGLALVYVSDPFGLTST